MSMLKVITPGAWDFHEPVVEMLKTSSRGLVGDDLSSFIKRAGHQAAEQMRHLKLASGEVPIHVLAVGSTEKFGANRNGDGFREATCRTSHDTFVKHARWYRNHRNKNPAKSYGIVKASWFNEPMSRIELIVALNGTKEAAERNGGLVADQELEKLAKGKELADSMACKVAFDVCSSCNNKARSPAEYCRSPAEGGFCKAGGLRTNIGQVLEDGHVLHADNPHPQFFDISNVFRPADRIAYVMGELQKAAAHGVVSGAELANQLGITAPWQIFLEPTMPSYLQRQVKTAAQLADEEYTLGQAARLPYTAVALRSVDETTSPPEDIRTKLAHYMRALVDERAVLPLQDFVALMTATPREKCADVAELTALALPGVYSRLLDEPGYANTLANNPYTPAPASTPTARQWATKHASAWSLAEPQVERRQRLAAIRQTAAPKPPSPELTKTAATAGPAAELAKHYALYKLAFLAAIPESDPQLPLTRSLAVLQNYV